MCTSRLGKMTVRKPGAASAAPRPKRSDAMRNRDQILQAAFSVFAKSGVDAQMAEIAEAAGVGVATLYRNFPSKEELINVLLVDHFDRVIEVAEEAVDAPDAWQAFTRLLRWMTAMQLENRALVESLAGRIRGSDELAKHRRALYDILGQVVRRAQEQGQLRRDVNESDIRAVLLAMARPRLASSESPLAQRLVRRLCDVILDGLRAPGASELEGPPLTTAELNEAFRSAIADAPPPRPFRRGRRPWPVQG